MSKNGLYPRVIKRVLDVLLSALALLVLSPVLLLTALLVCLKLGRPVLFRQPRPGKDEKIFSLYKFRSMTDELGEDGRLLPDAQRLTRFGKFLRASSLDELPELLNILRGDMSLVGPRPLSIYYLPHYPAAWRRRHSVRPGLTGLAQVSGRNSLPWDERFACDIRYVDALSFGLDCRIVLETALKVLRRQDVGVRGTARVRDYGPTCILENEGKSCKGMDGMRYSEMGSYWWIDGQAESREGDFSWLPPTDDAAFCFSGRNAIDLALRDILRSRPVREVYAPSYCCVSMLQAFVDRGIRVVFYPVRFSEGRFHVELPALGKDAVLLIMSYFGLDPDDTRAAIRKASAAGAVVIEDITHSLLRADSAAPESRYLVASLRKWLGIPTGGWLGKRGGTLAEKPTLDSNHAVEEKIAAMREKYAYLTGEIASKEHFLLAQAKFDNDLIHVDRGLKLDDWSMALLSAADMRQIAAQRRQNACLLLDTLSSMPKLTFPAFDREGDAPLYLPVFLPTAQRDSLRRYLTTRGFYCPVHWPEVMGAPAGVRENELSLLCDQRYGEGDMRALAAAIRSWAAEREEQT